MCRLLVSLLCLAKQFIILTKLNRSWGGRIVCQQLSKNGICSVGFAVSLALYTHAMLNNVY
jgi:hypothetical protein